jgi:hypothetical protein
MKIIQITLDEGTYLWYKELANEEKRAVSRQIEVELTKRMMEVINDRTNSTENN